MQAIFYPTHLAANNGAGQAIQGRVLGTVTVNTKGSGGNTLTVYDGTDATGTVLAVIDTTSALGTFLYDILAENHLALFVVLAGGVAADLTIGSY